MLAATESAFRHRDRLTPVERYLTEARYYGTAEGDREKEMDAYRSALEIDPDETTSLNNLANELNGLRRFAEAEEFAMRAVEIGGSWTFYANALQALVGQGKWDEAAAIVDRLAADRGADSPHYGRFAGDFAAAQGQYGRADSLYRGVLQTQQERFWQSGASFGLASVARITGRIREALTHLERAMAANAEGNPTGYLNFASQVAQTQLRFRDDRNAALATIGRALDRFPLEELAPVDRPYAGLALTFADAGEPARARALLEEYERVVDEPLWRSNYTRYGAEATIALAEGRLADAASGFRRWHDVGDPFCTECALFRLGEAYDRLGRPDSAVAAYERAVSASNAFGHYQDALYFAQAHKRLGELYEQRGDRDKAVEYYGKFVDLWQDADPELQPVVREVRERMVRLVGERQ